MLGIAVGAARNGIGDSVESWLIGALTSVCPLLAAASRGDSGDDLRREPWEGKRTRVTAALETDEE